MSPRLETYTKQTPPTPTESTDSPYTTLPNDEDDGAKLREKELKSWLKGWEQYSDGAIRDELPWFGPSEQGPRSSVQVVGPGGPMPLPGPIMRVISSIQGMAMRPEGGEPEGPESPYFSVAAVIPETRDLVREEAERRQRRLEVNRLTFRMALKRLGGVVPGQVEEYVNAAENGGAATESAAGGLMTWFWERALVDKDEIDELALRALGKAMISGSQDESAPPTEATGEDQPLPPHTIISWAVVAQAWESLHSGDRQRREWIGQQRQQHHQGAPSTAEPEPTFNEPDEVIEKVKADTTLDSHEKRLLGCIVDPTTLPTSFQHVHVPEKTIDAIRTMVSLPLLYPKAFSEGVLKSHSMNGALLLGPPGTGKTLLARAVAKESGARMLMVKPSDVMDMYVGEGEKLVKSVFSLARRLSPCVIFLDEVDALLASRISSRESGSAIAHRSVITEFMQEMDGLKTNKSQGNVIVIGATNRPFDLDDAVLRRLPRRLLIDLPGEPERLEILKIHLRDETLAPSVDLASLAKRTEMYSGSDLKNVCVAAALDAIKESVTVPWATATASPSPSVAEAQATGTRVLESRHFDRALTEVTPSSSESLGTLHDLRKWNDEFGEGRTKAGSKKSRWGGGKFGFGGKDGKGQDGRVMRDERTP